MTVHKADVISAFVLGFLVGILIAYVVMIIVLY